MAAHITSFMISADIQVGSIQNSKGFCGSPRTDTGSGRYPGGSFTGGSYTSVASAEAEQVNAE